MMPGARRNSMAYKIPPSKKVRITGGPTWAVGQIALLYGDDALIFWNNMGKPSWYDITGFQWTDLA